MSTLRWLARTSPKSIHRRRSNNRPSQRRPILPSDAPCLPAPGLTGGHGAQSTHPRQGNTAPPQQQPSLSQSPIYSEPAPDSIGGTRSPVASSDNYATMIEPMSAYNHTTQLTPAPKATPMTHPDPSEFPHARPTQTRFPIVDHRGNSNEIEQSRTPGTDKTCRQTDKTMLFYTPRNPRSPAKHWRSAQIQPAKKNCPETRRKRFSPQTEQPAQYRYQYR